MLRNKQTGFTLIEVMVALTVAAIALLALMQGLGQFVFQQASLQDRVAATWVAQNRLVELRLIEGETLEATKTEEMLGREWRVNYTTEPTQIGGVVKVTVTVGTSDSDKNIAKVSSIMGTLGG